MKKGVKNIENSGVSEVIAVILMVAITVVLAGVLYVWVMGITPADSSDTYMMGIANEGVNNGYITLDVASTAGNFEINTLIIEIHRNYTQIASGDLKYAAVNHTATYTEYNLNDTYIAYDNDNNGYCTEGDIIKIKKTMIQTGDQIRFIAGGVNIQVASITVT